MKFVNRVLKVNDKLVDALTTDEWSNKHPYITNISLVIMAAVFLVNLPF